MSCQLCDNHQISMGVTKNSSDISFSFAQLASRPPICRIRSPLSFERKEFDRSSIGGVVSACCGIPGRP